MAKKAVEATLPGVDMTPAAANVPQMVHDAPRVERVLGHYAVRGERELRRAGARNQLTPVRPTSVFQPTRALNTRLRIDTAPLALYVLSAYIQR